MNFKPPFVGAIDVGTSSSRFIVFDFLGRVVVNKQNEYESIYPKSGWHEQDPLVLWNCVKTCIYDVIDDMKQHNINIKNLKAIGITNQRETVVCFDKISGLPLCNAIVWSDKRTQQLVDVYKQQYEFRNYMEITGIPINTYFSALKIVWLLNNNKRVKMAQLNNTLKIGTIDTWLLHKLAMESGTNCFVTDSTNASRTMLMDIKKLKWSNEICNFFDISISCLPEIKSCSETYFKLNCFGLSDVSVSGCIGDQQAALLGQKCFEPGMCKNTYGTGCFVLFNCGTKYKLSKNRLVSTIGYHLKDNLPIYALEGSVAVAGSALKWLRDLNILKSFVEIDKSAGDVLDTNGLYFVTAFSGLFSPYWEPNARGFMIGLTSHTKKSHIVRAALEAICFQIKAIIDAMNRDSNQPLTELKASGGLTKSNVCMQIQADLLGIAVEKPVMSETTALGAAMAAGLGANIWKNIDELKKLNQENPIKFYPEITKNERETRCSKWHDAVQRSYGWAKL